MRVAIVGTGGVAGRHLGVLAQIAAVEIVGHVSRDRARATAQAARWGGRAYTHLAAMVARERPEAVWLCVTPDRHGELEEALIQRGVPFFVEKPLAADLATAERIAAALAARPLIVGVGYKLRALDTLPLVQTLLAERPARMLLARWHDTTPPPTWWRDERRSGGQMVEQAAHLVDLARLLCGEPTLLGAVAQQHARAAYPDGDVQQVTAALLRFPGGIPATLTATCLLERRQAIHLQIICEGRALTLSDRALRVETGHETQVIPVRHDPFLTEDQAFLRAVAERDPRYILSAYSDAVLTHRLCVAIREAART